MSKLTLKKLDAKISKLEQEPEKKQYFYNINNTGVGTGGTLWSIGNPAQGSTSVQRIGASIKPVSLEFTYLLESEIADAYNLFRVMVVQSKLDVLVTGDMPAVFQPLTNTMMDKFTVLYDREHTLENMPSNGVYYTHYTAPITKTVHPRRKSTFIDGTTTDVSGGIYLYCVSDSVAVNHPDLEKWYSVLNFTDA